jgi:hypothetical protein
MDSLKGDEFWHAYEKASELHRRAMQARLEAESDLAVRPSQETLQRWNDAHRQEDSEYEQLKAAERVVWAKYKTS